MMISVNSTPTTELFLNQPTTSVARVEALSAVITLPNARLVSVGRISPNSSSMSKNGLRDLSVRLRSSDSVRWNDSSFNTTRSDTGVERAVATPAIDPLVGRRDFTSYSPGCKGRVRKRDGLLSFAILGED